jgi:tripartite-type tricarboxylate transporter receptor subunit TctC
MLGGNDAAASPGDSTLALLLNHHAIAQASYPDRPIKMIVPLAAASAVDVGADRHPKDGRQ